MKVVWPLKLLKQAFKNTFVIYQNMRTECGVCLGWFGNFLLPNHLIAIKIIN